ncbi:predicted protein [Naegleria gruberi]|uniref:ubiquitinyl hydrolase 1 n=1 Tax=Naegleria gruberi TaxID=5762 RepID=D2VSY0_NAEGR|nr:uncharacterized protein NAEGRDRAFT_72100 [Naegleria gruberi]EFC40056.1 predicted protein [Naegleria gruberi]|eukprot:XP_002672800.1 predicted protein [Naegleria gruberi strain NEG-M]
MYSYPHSEKERNIKECDVYAYTIQEILDNHKRSFRDLYVTLSRENQDKYDNRIAEEKLKMSNNLLNTYSTFKTSNSIYISFESSSLILDTYKEKMRTIFEERKANYQLHTYLEKLQVMVNNLPSYTIPSRFPLIFKQIQDCPCKPKWTFLVDYFDQLNNLSSNIIEFSTRVFETGQVDDNVEILYMEMEDLIQKVLHPNDNTTNQALYIAGLWPRVTKTNILKLLLDDQTNQKLKNLVGCYGVLITLLQRAERLKALEYSKMTTLHSRELENKGHENWKPSDHPYWLILEIEMNIMIRPVQVRVANHMIHSHNNMVMVCIIY